MSENQVRCVLCVEVIPEKTKPEHVLLNALGGRMTVSTVLCPTCNNEMGNGPDQDLADSVSFIRNICSLNAGDGDPAPSIRGLEVNGERLDLLPGMDVQMRPRKPLDLKVTDDEIAVIIGAYSDAQAESLAEGAARSIAKTLGREGPEVIAAIKGLIMKERQAEIIPAPSIHHRFEFGKGKSQQAMAKACLVLWGKAVGNLEATHQRYDQIRGFIVAADKNEAQVDLVKLDTRPLPPMPEPFGTNPNLIWVGSDANGRTYGYYRLYGAIAWRFLLCESGAPANQTAYLISNPLNNSVWRYHPNDDAILDRQWVFADWETVRDYAAVEAALAPLLQLAHEASRETTVTRWVEEAALKAGLKEGDALREDHLRQISDYLAPRVTALLTQSRIPLGDE